jgi:hypothetical protein
LGRNPTAQPVETTVPTSSVIPPTITIPTSISIAIAIAIAKSKLRGTGVQRGDLARLQLLRGYATKMRVFSMPSDAVHA